MQLIVFYAVTKPDAAGVHGDIRRAMRLPFIPTLGMAMLLPGFGCHMLVDEVSWSYDEPDHVAVFFDEESVTDADLPTFDEAVAAGWEAAS